MTDPRGEWPTAKHMQKETQGCEVSQPGKFGDETYSKDLIEGYASKLEEYGSGTANHSISTCLP